MAELLGHEAALFFPTATMANQARCARRAKPGSMLLAEERTHVLIYEWGGPAIHSGLVMKGVEAEAGRVTPEHIEAEEELGPGGVVVLENTHRSSGGRIWPLDEFRATVDAAHERGAALHLDGARLFNASVGAGLAAGRVGAARRLGHDLLLEGARLPARRRALRAPPQFIERAWEGKYLFGGAMRQAGVIAAAALYALDHNVERLADDHARARRLAEGIGLDVSVVDTNFVAARRSRQTARRASRSAASSSATSGRACCARSRISASRTTTSIRRSSSSPRRSALLVLQRLEHVEPTRAARREDRGEEAGDDRRRRRTRRASSTGS